MKKIVLTGGGTAGHVTPNIALLPSLKEAGFEVEYIGSYTGIEKTLIEKEGIPYHGISSGKFRRYCSLKNLSDPFRVLNGIRQAKKLMKEIKPDVVFSKGGFVSVPVVLAAGARHIPVIIHESDMTPGLANKIAMRKATKICCNFPETVKYLPADKAVLTGSPIRQELLTGSKEKGFAFCGFTKDKPVLLVVGGSTGAVRLNNAVRGALDELLKEFQICHLTGKGKSDESFNQPGYVQFEYISDEMKDLLAMADLVVSRAGANAICEILAARKPNILVPLSANASRGDQILNANSFKKQGFSFVLDEDVMTKDDFLAAVKEVFEHREDQVKAMESSESFSAIDNIMGLIREAAGC